MKKTILSKFLFVNGCVVLLILPLTVMTTGQETIGSLVPRYEVHVFEQYRLSSAAGFSVPVQSHGTSPDMTWKTLSSSLQSDASSMVSAGSDWSNSGGNAQRNGQSGTTGPLAADLLWSGASSSLISWLPVTEGNRLFVIRQTGWPGAVNESPVIAMDLSTGEELWRQNIPYHPNDWTTWVAGVKQGHVYASRSGNGASVDDNLYCLDVQTGAVLWVSTDLIDAGPYDGVVFAPDGDPVIASFYDIWRFNSEDGSLVWHANRLGSVSGSCGGAIYGDGFYVSDVVGGGQAIVRYDLNTGQQQYSGPVMPGFLVQNTPMVGPDGTVYLSRTQNNPAVDYFYAFTDTGTALVEKWHHACAWSTFSEFAVGPDGGVYCILPGPRIGKIDSAGNVTAQSELIGDPEYTYLSPHFAVDAMGTVYFSNGGFADGRLWVFTPELVPLWNVSVPNINIGGPALGEDGTLLVCGTGTTMRAYRAPQPSFNISISSSRTKIRAAVTNIGVGDATNVNWAISVSGGVFGRINVSTMGARSVLAVAETMNVTTERLMFGFGKLAISVHVTCDEAVSAAKDASGVIFLFFLGGVN
jgi:hypothetical protein